MQIPDPHKALLPLIRIADRSGKVPNDQPSREQETTRFPVFPWDLRTIIMVFPDHAPFRFLNLNTTLGLTGVPFDQRKNWNHSDPKDAFDLQFCLEGGNEHASYKQYHSVARELEYRHGEVLLKLDDRLHFQGDWPDYRIQYRQPDNGLEVSLRLVSWPDFHWWLYSPRLYCHYTSFCDCRVEWDWNGAKGALDLPALHDHGWGRTLLPLRFPLRVFRYEVLRLPLDQLAISLWTEGPARLELKNVGLIRKEKQSPPQVQPYHCQVLEWETFPNYAGLPCRIPNRWVGTQQGKAGTFVYEALRMTEPRPILGEGFMYGFDYQGILNNPGLPVEDVKGSGYVEHLGRFL